MVPYIASTSLIPSKFSNFATTSPNNLNCPNVPSISLNPSKFYLFATTSPNNLNCPNVATTSPNPSNCFPFAPTSPNHLNCPALALNYHNPSHPNSPNLYWRTTAVTEVHRPCRFSSFGLPLHELYIRINHICHRRKVFNQ